MGANIKKLKCYLFGTATKELVWVSVELILDILSSDILGSISSTIALISAIVCIAGSRNLKAAVLMAGAILNFIIAGIYIVRIILLVFNGTVSAGFVIIIICIEGIVIGLAILAGIFALKLKNLVLREFGLSPQIEMGKEQELTTSSR